MAVDIAHAPPETEPQDDYDDRVHTGLFWLCIIALLVGVITVGASRVWAAKTSDIVRFEAFDQTAQLTGEVSFKVDQASLAPLSSPQVQPFEDTRRTQTPGLVDNRALLLTNDLITVGDKHTALLAQYFIDVRDISQIPTPAAWSFIGTNPADRSHAYAINFPFNTGRGPYAYWLNEVDAAVTVTQTGQPFANDGITVVRLQGHLDPTGVDPFYMEQMARAGIPASVTLTQLEPTLKALGTDLAGVVPGLRLKVTPAENAVLDRPIALNYTMSGDISLLVEPHTGTIVSVEKSSQSYSAHFDAAALGAVTAVFTNHRDVPGVAGALGVLQRIGSAPPTAVFDLTASQTPDSVRAVSDYATTRRGSVDRLREGIPTALLVVGIVLVVIGVLAGVQAWRHRNDELID